MKGTTYLVETCRVCGLDDWTEILSLGEQPLANGFLDPDDRFADEPAYPLEVVLCQHCHLLSLRHMVAPDQLFSHYVYVSQNSPGMLGHMRNIVGVCADWAGLAPGDLVVEMGSNIGTQLKLFDEAGFRVVGVDPAKNLASIARDDGVETIAAFFGPAAADSVVRSHGRSKVVLGRQCFAHIDDVHHVLDGVDAVLAPDGVLVIEVPYLVDMLAENQFDTIVHEHASYFSLYTLDTLFAMHGLRVTDVQRAPVHGGSIVVCATRESAGREPTPAVAELLDLEERSGLRTETPYLEFAARTRELITAVSTLVEELVDNGKRVAGYGAPSKGTALLMACGLTDRHLQFCSDTTSFKQGKLLPGSRVPVWSPERARTAPPDYYLLLAWNYAEEIIAREQEFLADGGHFIIPALSPRLVPAEPPGVAASSASAG